MSYILNDGSDCQRSRRPLLLGLAVVGVLALVVTAFVVGRRSDDGPGGMSAPALGRPTITWSSIGSQPVPSSPVHGPFQTTNGLAAGFSHDELGAVLAAINISARLTSAAGPVVYETTARQQAVGDIEAMIGLIRSQRSNAVAGSTVPTEVFYRITGGDPRGDLVAVSIAFSTPQSTGLGGHGEISRVLQWVEGDWKVQVPPAPPQLITSVDGYASLGAPVA